MIHKLLNRKLHHTLLALSASAAVFGVLLLAGTPALSGAEPATASAGTLMLSADMLATDNISVDATHAIQAAELAPPIDAESDAPTGTIHRRSPDRLRSLLALPYFSFAQGLRHNRS